MTRREPTPAEVERSISRLTTDLVSSSLVDDQLYPVLNRRAQTTVVTTQTPVTAASLRAVTYPELYHRQARERIFNVVFLDKALLQMSYEWSGRQLIKHRLAFLPSPDLREYQAAPELYDEEQQWGDNIDPQSVAVPLRFDYDRNAAGTDHPAAHLTLGQYLHCRIPVSAPLTPAVFVDFIIRHFYRLPGQRRLQIDLDLDHRFELTGTDHQAQLHVRSPGNR